jgi:hypothetical protein
VDDPDACVGRFLTNEGRKEGKRTINALFFLHFRSLFRPSFLPLPVFVDASIHLLISGVTVLFSSHRFSFLLFSAAAAVVALVSNFR